MTGVKAKMDGAIVITGTFTEDLLTADDPFPTTYVKELIQATFTGDEAETAGDIATNGQPTDCNE